MKVFEVGQKRTAICTSMSAISSSRANTALARVLTTAAGVPFFATPDRLTAFAGLAPVHGTRSVERVPIEGPLGAVRGVWQGVPRE